MAKKKISELATLSEFEGDELFVVAKNGENYSVGREEVLSDIGPIEDDTINGICV